VWRLLDFVSRGWPVRGRAYNGARAYICRNTLGGRADFAAGL